MVGGPLGEAGSNCSGMGNYLDGGIPIQAQPWASGCHKQQKHIR